MADTTWVVLFSPLDPAKPCYFAACGFGDQATVTRDETKAYRFENRVLASSVANNFEYRSIRNRKAEQYDTSYSVVIYQPSNPFAEVNRG